MRNVDTSPTRYLYFADDNRPPSVNFMLAVALIGAGRIGGLHAQLLADNPRVQLAAVYDADGDAAAAVAAKFGVAVTDADAAINAADALLVASATATHCDYVERAVAAGRAVLCEKPPGLEVARVNACRDAIGRSALGDAPLVQLGFNRRFDPTHAALQARVAAGEIGALEKLIITSRDPALPSAAYLKAAGGLFRDMMIHDFDLARFILGDEPTRIFAAGAALVDAKSDEIDTAMVVMQTAAGALCHINCSRRAVYGYDQRVEAFGGDGMLISNNAATTQVAHFAAAQTDARAPLQWFFTERYRESYQRQLDAFIDAVENATPASPTFEDGRRALLLAEAAEQSMRDGCWADVNFTGA